MILTLYNEEFLRCLMLFHLFYYYIRQGKEIQNLNLGLRRRPVTFSKMPVIEVV